MEKPITSVHPDANSSLKRTLKNISRNNLVLSHFQKIAFGHTCLSVIDKVIRFLFDEFYSAGVAEWFRRQPAELFYMGSIPIPSSIHF